MFPNAVCGPRAEGTNAEALGDRAARQGASEGAYLKLGCEKQKRVSERAVDEKTLELGVNPVHWGPGLVEG